MEKNFIIVLIAVAVVFFVLGGAGGIIMQNQKYAPAVSKAETITRLSSKLVVSMVIYGEVTKIDDRNLTLSFGGDEMTLKVGTNAKIYTLANQEKNPNQKTATFEEIQAGDKLNVAVSITKEGDLNVQSVIILPKAQ